MDLRARLSAELERRQKANPRYSLRAFALSLGTHHTTLLRLLRQGRRLTPSMTHRLGQRLGLTPAQIARATAHEQDAAVLALLPHPGFRTDSRWLAMMTGLPLDEVNVTLQRLLSGRRLTMHTTRTWIPEGT